MERFQTNILRIVGFYVRHSANDVKDMELLEVHRVGLKQINALCFTRTIKRSRATGIFLIKGLILGQRYDNIYPSHDLFEFF